MISTLKPYCFNMYNCIKHKEYILAVSTYRRYIVFLNLFERFEAHRLKNISCLRILMQIWHKNSTSSEKFKNTAKIPYLEALILSELF